MLWRTWRWNSWSSIENHDRWTTSTYFFRDWVVFSSVRRQKVTSWLYFSWWECITRWCRSCHLDWVGLKMLSRWFFRTWRCWDVCFVVNFWTEDLPIDCYLFFLGQLLCFAISCLLLFLSSFFWLVLKWIFSSCFVFTLSVGNLSWGCCWCSPSFWCRASRWWGKTGWFFSWLLLCCRLIWVSLRSYFFF